MTQYVSSPSALGKRNGSCLFSLVLNVGGTYVTGLVGNEWAVIDTKDGGAADVVDFDQFLKIM